MARPYLVIGLGRFGSYLAEALSELGADVIALDRSQDRRPGTAAFGSSLCSPRMWAILDSHNPDW